MTLAKKIEFLSFTWRLTKGRVLLGAIATLLVGLTEGLSLILLIPIVAAAAPGSSEKMANLPVLGPWLSDNSFDLAILLIIFVFLVSLQAILTRTKDLYNQHILHNASDSLRNNLFEKVSLARWQAIRTQENSDLNHVLTTDADRTVAAIRSAQSLFHNIVMFAVYMGLAALVSWQMAIFASVVGTTLFAVLYPIRRKATTYGRETTNLFEAQNRTILEFIGSLRLVKLFTIEKPQAKAYAANLKMLRHRVIEFLSISSWGTIIFQVGAATIGAIFVWLSLKIYGLDIARISVLILIFVRLAPRFNTIQGTMQSFLTQAPAFTNYIKMLDFFKARQESDPEISLPAPKLTAAIQTKNVTVDFPNSHKPALDNVSFSIKANRVTALIGPSGSGKSTLADILLGLTQPHQGQVIIDAIPLSDSHLRAWRSSVACVSQDAILLNDTIAENLKVGRGDATEEEMWDALDTARIGNLIRSLPDGLETIAQDRGTRFSGGERQRITLARALIRRPQFLILDEATSALDWENQREIAKAIKSLRGKLTVLTIAHRASLITFADDVIALEEGQVVENGRFDTLRADKNSVLSKMIEGDRAD